MDTPDRSRPVLVKRGEAAHQLNVSVSTITRLVQEGALRGVKIGRGLRIPQEDIDLVARGGSAAARRAHVADDDLSTWPPTPSMLGEAGGNPQADDDARALEAARRAHDAE